MRYLVTAMSGPGFGSKEQAVDLLENIVLPGFDHLMKLEKQKKIIAGGLPVGERAFVFIAEAKSNDELDKMLRDIPMWGVLDWEVTPLQSFSARAEIERKAVKGTKK